MSDHSEKHLSPSEAGLVALFACAVRTLEESDPTFRSRFSKNLEGIYYQVRESPMFGIAGLEALTLARDLLKK